MRVLQRRSNCAIGSRVLLGCGALLSLACVGTAAEPVASPNADRVAKGREIFLRSWIPNDPRSHGGDGLGPVYNDSSCIACHNQGGAGGGGAAEKNVNVLSADFDGSSFSQTALVRARRQAAAGNPPLLRSVVRNLFNVPTPERKIEWQMPSDAELKKHREKLLEEVATMHPAFRSAKSVVLHHESTDENYNRFRAGHVGVDELVGLRGGIGGFDGIHQHFGAEAATSPFAREPEVNEFQFQQGFDFEDRSSTENFSATLSRRNPTALFGVGAIDRVPDAVLLKAAQATFDGFPEISGRVAKVKGGKIGRFGWKGQTASLRDFTVTACAVELGLHVPEHAQGANPLQPNYRPTGYDLTKDECSQLVEYLADLPQPQQIAAPHPQIQQYRDRGAELFASIGCAHCHTPTLGETQGIYSDLLLHDMGPMTADTGSYSVFEGELPLAQADGTAVPSVQELRVFLEQFRETFEHAGGFGGGFSIPFETVRDGEGPAFAEKPTDWLAPFELQKLPENPTLALEQEWRTPPLWGARDSAPYLHDGSARTLEDAIRMHGGEGLRSAVNFDRLKANERAMVIAFLRSLAAPISE